MSKQNMEFNTLSTTTHAVESSSVKATRKGVTIVINSRSIDIRTFQKVLNGFCGRIGFLVQMLILEELLREMYIYILQNMDWFF